MPAPDSAEATHRYPRGRAKEPATQRPVPSTRPPATRGTGPSQPRSIAADNANRLISNNASPPSAEATQTTIFPAACEQER